MSASPRFLCIALCVWSCTLPGLSRSQPPFPVMDAAQIQRACDAALSKAEGAVRRMERRAPAGVLEEWNRVQILVEDVAMPGAVFATVHPDKAAREAGDACYARGLQFDTRMTQSEALHARVRGVRTANDRQARFRQDLLDRFADAGVSLPPDKRNRVNAIKARLEMLRQEFFRNVDEDSSTIAFAPEEMGGMGSGFLAKLRRDEAGRYVMPVRRSFFAAAITGLTDSVVRQRLATAWLRVGGERNVAILDEVMALRQELAATLAFANYAEYVLRRRMARDSGTVDAFLARVWSVVEPMERAELDQVRAFKARDAGRSLEETVVMRGDVPHYFPKIKAAAGGSGESPESEIPLGKALAYMFGVAERLYGIRITRRDSTTWPPDATCHDVHEEGGGAFVGAFCLDIVTRDGKGLGASAIHVFGASRVERRKPVSVLIASVGREKTSLGELEDLMHEFGHVMHGVLSETDFAAHSGTRVTRDFVEAPSQMFEAWAWDERALALLRERCPECTGLDAASLDRRRLENRFGRGVAMANQWRMATFDMALATGEPGGSLEVWNRLQARGPIIDGPGTFRFAATLHIPGGYGAGYYGYLWSRAIGEDLLSAFRGDLLDPAVGRRFRKVVLSQGAQKHPAELAREFLGREPGIEGFIAKMRE